MPSLSALPERPGHQTAVQRVELMPEFAQLHRGSALALSLAPVTVRALSRRSAARTDAGEPVFLLAVDLMPECVPSPMVPDPALSLAPAILRARSDRSVAQMDAGRAVCDRNTVVPRFLVRLLPFAYLLPSCKLQLTLMAARSVQNVRREVELAQLIRTVRMASAGTGGAKRTRVLAGRATDLFFPRGDAGLVSIAICPPYRTLGARARLHREEAVLCVLC